MTAFAAFILKVISGCTVRWLGCIPEEKQRIYYANHTSNLDAAVIWAVFPAYLRLRVRPVAAQDYWKKNKIRLYVAKKIFNCVLIERHKVSASNNPLELMLIAIEEGFSLIIFPEGGRSANGGLLPFKSGIYHIAQKLPHLELVPVYLENLNRILPKGEILPVPVLSRVTFGAPIRLEEKETKIEFLSKAQRELINLCQP